MLKVILNKLRKRYIIKRIFYERLTEPIHLNIISLFVAVFGSYKKKIEYDLIMRQNHAYAILNAAEQAVGLGLKKISIIEFGVASGAGLINMMDAYHNRVS